MNEYFIHQHRFNTVKTVKSRTVSIGNLTMRVFQNDLIPLEASSFKIQSEENQKKIIKIN